MLYSQFDILYVFSFDFIDSKVYLPICILVTGSRVKKMSYLNASLIFVCYLCLTNNAIITSNYVWPLKFEGLVGVGMQKSWCDFGYVLSLQPLWALLLFKMPELAN